MSEAARFQQYVSPEPNTGCFIWTGAMNAEFRGRFYYKGRIQFAHRVAYQLEHGPLPENVCVLHSCDTSWCVNHTHLHPGDRDLNAKEREQRNRGAKASRTHCKRGHPYDATNTYTWAGLPGTRMCRACRAFYGAKK